MKKNKIILVLVLLFSITISAKDWWNNYFTSSKNIHLISSVTGGLFSGTYDAMTLRGTDTYDPSTAYAYRGLEITSYFISGASAGKSSKMKFYPIVSDAVLTLSYRYVFNNLAQNIYRDRPLFYNPDNKFIYSAGGQAVVFVGATILNIVIYEVFR